MLALRALLPLQHAKTSVWRTFSTARVLAVKQLPPRPKIEEADIEENFLKGSGPGGQKINKTASAVQLLHKPTGIVVKSQATRSRIQNRKHARLILAEKLEEIEKGDESRKKIKEGLKSKRKRSSEKKSRRKYRKLAEGKEGDADVEGEYEEGGEEGELEEVARSVEEGVVVPEAGSSPRDDENKEEIAQRIQTTTKL